MTQKDFKEKLKKALKDFDPYKKRTWENLINLGFSIGHGSKHYKLYYHGKRGEYLFPISCTSSDYRMTLNMCSVIMNKIGDDLR